jgi:hypothetical protein
LLCSANQVARLLSGQAVVPGNRTFALPRPLVNAATTLLNLVYPTISVSGDLSSQGTAQTGGCCLPQQCGLLFVRCSGG